MSSSAPYSPRVSTWGYVWRIALTVALSLVVWLQSAQSQWDHARVLFFVDIGIGLLSYVLVFYRRRFPFPVAMILAVAGAVSGVSAGPSTWAAVSFATRRDLGRLAALGVVLVVSGQAYNLIEPEGTDSSAPTWVDIALIAVITVAMLLWGMYVGSRRELVWTLRERARQAESEQELRVEKARSAERERIAREMHDVLAHRISLVTMHAGALAYRHDLPPEQVQETAALIQSKAHEALTDLREVLGVLRGDDSTRRPQPTLGDLRALVAEASDSGMRVDLSVDITDEPSEGAGRTVYRLVQEGLTNARKHAAGARVAVAVGGTPDDGITVTVSNPTPVGAHAGRTPGAGLGLVGLHERADLAGGRLRVRDRPDSFTLEAWLPWRTT